MDIMGWEVKILWKKRWVYICSKVDQVTLSRHLNTLQAGSLGQDHCDGANTSKWLWLISSISTTVFHWLKKGKHLTVAEMPITALSLEIELFYYRSWLIWSWTQVAGWSMLLQSESSTLEFRIVGSLVIRVLIEDNTQVTGPAIVLCVMLCHHNLHCHQSILSTYIVVVVETLVNLLDYDDCAVFHTDTDNHPLVSIDELCYNRYWLIWSCAQVAGGRNQNVRISKSLFFDCQSDDTTRIIEFGMQLQQQVALKWVDTWFW